jgi:tetratricopeptide (TPR) repeat protein
MTEDHRHDKPGTSAFGERSVAVGCNFGSISTGDVSASVLLPLPKEIPPPDRSDNLPPLLSSFMGRETESQALADVLRLSEDSVAQVVTQSVSGLGGVGKSALVLNYAHTHLAEHTLTWWIPASQSETITASLVQLARRLLARFNTRDFTDEQLCDWALSWLRVHDGWLLIFDNANSPESVHPFHITHVRGRYLITSRLGHGWRTITPNDPLRLDVLPLDVAAALLLDLGQRPPEERGAAESLAAELGCLPLALQHAGSHMARTRTTCPAYHKRFSTRPNNVLTVPGDPHMQTIAGTLSVTLDALADSNPIAVILLRVLAWLGPDQLPRSVLSALADPDDPDSIDDALAYLADFSMISLNPETVSTHRLVQTLARTPDADDPHRQPDAVVAARQTAAALLAYVIPASHYEVGDWPGWRDLLPHVESHIAHTDRSDDTMATCSVLERTTLFLAAREQYTSAFAYCERAIDTATRLLGPGDPETLHIRRHLASIYGLVDNQRSISLFQEALANCERGLGRDHHVTIGTRNHLAVQFARGGDVAQAVTVFEESLADCLRALGSDVSITLDTRNHLAEALMQGGNIDRATELLNQNIAECARVLESGHRITLRTRERLAAVHWAGGDQESAVALHEQNLADCEGGPGLDDPVTLDTRDTLAHVYEQAGNPGRAVTLFERNLAAYERVRGLNDPATLAAAMHIAHACRSVEEPNRAVAVLERALAGYERARHPDDPDILSARNTLAHAYEHAGKPELAIPLFEQNLAEHERINGPNHADTLNAPSHIAHAYRAAGQPDRAVSVCERSLASTEQLLGADHLYTFAFRSQLACAYQAVGDLERAMPLFKQNVADSKRVLGQYHPATLSAMDDLAIAYGLAEDPARAVPLFEQTLQIRERLAGHDDVKARVTRHRLAHAYAAAENPQHAVALLEQDIADRERILGSDHPATESARSCLEGIRQNGSRRQLDA